MKTNVYEWIYLVRQNDYEALNCLIQYFRPAITRIWADLFINGNFSTFVEKEDFFIDADEILVNCISTYRPDYKRSFQAYYKTSVKNKGNDYRRTRYLQKYEGIYNQISLDAHLRDFERLYYVDIVNSQEDVNSMVLNKVYKEMVMEKAEHFFDLTALEIIELKLEGYKTVDITRMLNLGNARVNSVWKKFKNWVVNIDSLAD